MKTKLTLSIEKSVVEEAKEYAREQSFTLSALIEDYLGGIIKEHRNPDTVHEAQYQKKLKPEVVKKMKSFQRLAGLLKDVPNDKSYDDLRWEYLERQ